MALLLELANYSLQNLKSVPEEVSCTSKGREWGVPGENGKYNYKAPVMKSVIQKNEIKGIQSTLYDPR